MRGSHYLGGLGLGLGLKVHCLKRDCKGKEYDY